MSNKSSSSDLKFLDKAKGIKEYLQAAQLFYAVSRNKIALLQKILEADVSPHTQGYGSELNMPDLKSALHVACSKGNEEAILLLLKHGARVNNPDGFGRTPIDEWAGWLVSKMVRDVSLPIRVWNVLKPPSPKKWIKKSKKTKKALPLMKKKKGVLDIFKTAQKNNAFDWSFFVRELEILQHLKKAGGKGTQVADFRLHKIHWSWEYVEQGLN